jgi:hypothetical protein
LHNLGEEGLNILPPASIRATSKVLGAQSPPTRYYFAPNYRSAAKVHKYHPVQNDLGNDLGDILRQRAVLEQFQNTLF